MAHDFEKVTFDLELRATEAGHDVSGGATVVFDRQKFGRPWTQMIVTVNGDRHEFVSRSLKPNQTDAILALHLALNGEAKRQAKLKQKPELAAETRSVGRLKRRQAPKPKRRT